MARIALLGGSFNPPTLSHLRMATELIRAGKVDQVWFVPTANHPFKNTQTSKASLRNFYDREEMLWQMIRKSKYADRIKISFAEEEEHLSGYTWDTIRHFKSAFKHEGHVFYWVMGTDCVDDLGKWVNVPWILENVTIIVYPRGGYLEGDDGYWPVLKTHHMVLSLNDVAESFGSSTEARENPDGGQLDPDVAAIWKSGLADT